MSRSKSSGSDVLTAATEAMRRAVEELAAWPHSGGDDGRYLRLQSVLRLMQSSDGKAFAAKEQGASAAAIADYRKMLEGALTEIERLEEALTGERQRLSPRLDAAAKHQEFRSAYARALSR